MEIPPVSKNRMLVMTHAAAIGVAVGLGCTACIGGAFFSALYFETSAKRSLAELRKVQKEILGHAFVPMFRDTSGSPVSDEAGLKNFRLSREDSVTWSFVGGYEEERHIEISGDGSVTVFNAAEVKQVATLDESECFDFFQKVITGGLAGYSEEAVDLKCDLALKCGLMYPVFTPSGVTGREIRISIPRLGLNRQFSMEEPEYERETYPDIIEYRSAVEIEKDILVFIP